MKLTITIDCDNAAFDSGNRDHEAARILTGFVRSLSDLAPVDTRSLFDINGNKVGEARWTD